MSKFNTKKIVEKVENKAGGQAYKQSDEMAFVSLLLTSFVKDQFYRKADESLSDMKGYIKKIKDKEFLAKSAIFARDEFGMRSITHALAGELASEISGKEWSKNFYSKVVSRVDDMSEILSYYLQNKTNYSDKINYYQGLYNQSRTRDERERIITKLNFFKNTLNQKLIKNHTKSNMSENAPRIFKNTLNLCFN